MTEVPGQDPTSALDAALGGAPFGLVHLDHELRVVWTNTAFRRYSHLDPAALLGTTLHDVYPDLDIELEQLALAVHGGQQATGEYLLRRRSQSDPAGTRTYQLVLFRTDVGDPAGHGLAVLVRDATSEVESSARLAIATERLHLLAELGGQLSATLDVDRLTQLTAELLVPVLGDACAVYAVDDDDPEKRSVGRATSAGGTRFGPDADPTPPPPVSQVLRAGTVLRYAHVPAGLVDDEEGDRPGHVLVVPLRARGQVVGALCLARFGGTRAYESDEIAFVVEAAGRVGMAVDNARLFARQRDVAFSLQHMLLPHRLPDIPGLDLAARYIAGSAETGVGGDWFDVIPLPDGRLAMVIGDVMGRGVRAAAVMGQLRAAVRAYTVIDLTPSRLLALLDRVVTALGQVQLVTCLYGVLDPVSGSFRYAGAGHHPALLRAADGTVTVLDGPMTPPLGVLDLHDGPPVESTVTVPPGSTLLLYTDGLVEERHIDLGTRHDQLAASFAAATGSPERVVDALLQAMGRTGDHGDDVALLAVHLAPAPADGAAEPERAAQFTVTGEPTSVAAARRFLSSVLDTWGMRALADTAVLLVSETVTNALLHARSTADVRVHRTGNGVEVEVLDLDDRLPTPRIVDADAESGRGLHLLTELSAAWGAEPSHAGKRVWFRLDLPDR